MLSKNHLIKALELLKENRENVLGFKKIHSGYTNISYKLTLKDNVYQVRFPKQDFIDWNKEKKIYASLFPNQKILLDQKTGILIKPWIEGWNPSKEEMIKNKKLLKKAITEFNSLQGISVNQLPWDFYKKHESKLGEEVIDEYYKLIKKHQKNLVFSHTDLHGKNMLWDGTKFTLIDFEYTCLAPKGFDFIILDMHLDKRISLSMDRKIYIELEYMNAVLTHLWYLSISRYSKIKNRFWAYKLNKKAKRIIKYYFI